jgi:ribosomal protein L12E/L44/L45/RPP1/RPP2
MFSWQSNQEVKNLENKYNYLIAQFDTLDMKCMRIPKLVEDLNNTMLSVEALSASTMVNQIKGEQLEEKVKELSNLVVAGAFAPGGVLSVEAKSDFDIHLSNYMEKHSNDLIESEEGESEKSRKKNKRVGKKTRDRLKRQGKWPPAANRMPPSRQQHRGYD